MSAFTRLKAGEKVVIREGAYNACLDAAEAHIMQTGGRKIEGPDEVSRFVVRIKNNTGAQINFGNPVMLAEASSSLRVFTGDHYETTDEPTFSGVFRSATETTMFPQQYAVAMEPIPDGEFGRACVRGVCVANTAGSQSGWLLPIFTSSSSGFAVTTKRTNARILYALAASQYSVIYLDDAPWQTRRSNPACDTAVTSITRGTSFGSAATEDGFRDTHAVTLSLGGTWEEVIGPSIIRVPVAGVYDFRYTLYAELNLNGGNDGGPLSGLFGFYIRNLRVQAKLSLVDSSTGAYVSGVNWPSSDGNGGGVINAPFLVETGGGASVAYSGQHRGNMTIESRFSLSSNLCVGLVIGVNSHTVGVPSIALKTQGTGIVRPAEQDIYVAPPVP